MRPWLSQLAGIFKDPDGKPNWPRIGAVLAAVIAGAWTAFAFFVEHRASHDQGISADQIAQIQKPLAEELAAQRARNEKLTDMLLDKNPGAAPGARQALSGAVGSITQGAEEGDPRFMKALGLLKENKIAEATQLLNAVAKDKTAHAEQAATQAEKDRKEAAIAYRNLGAIAGLRDPKAAREAYAKAVALDPDNAEGLYWDGWFQLQAKNLAAAEKSYRAGLQLAGKGAGENQIFWARTGLGDIAVARGHLNAALAAYGEARSVMERLAGSDAGNADWQRDLIVSCVKIAEVFPGEALLMLTRAAAIANQLRDEGRLAPTDAWMPEDLARQLAELPKK
jgi:tetratricopeptide (TPR) repeat protein